MVSTEDAVIARLKSHGEKFEILVDPDLALKVKKGKEVPLDNLVVYKEVYEDVNKGQRAPDANINKAFGTDDFREIAYEIIRKGDVQITTEQRREMRKNKIKEIATLIARRAVDPQSKSPHPPQRILNAMEEVEVEVDPQEPASAQVEEVIDALRPVLPLSVEQIEIKVKIPAEHAGKAYGKVEDFGQVNRGEWRDDGSWVGVIEIPAGMQGEFYDMLSKLTEGEAEAQPMDG